MTPEEITILLEIAKHCLQDPELLDRISFEMNMSAEDLNTLKDKLIAYLLR
jgi:hypothetical protein